MFSLELLSLVHNACISLYFLLIYTIKFLLHVVILFQKIIRGCNLNFVNILFIFNSQYIEAYTFREYYTLVLKKFPKKQFSDLYYR